MIAVTARRQRGSIKPLSFYGVKFKLPAVVAVPAKPLSEGAPRGDRTAPDRIALYRPSEGGITRDTKPI